MRDEDDIREAIEAFDQHDPHKIPARVIIGLVSGLFLIVFFCFLVLGYVMLGQFLGPHGGSIFGNTALLGDSFNILTALFSGGALVGVIFTLLLGQKTLRLQKKELRDNTEQLEGQKDEMIRQNQHLGQQAITNQFFQMLNSWQELVARTTVTYQGRRTNDKPFTHIVNNIIEECNGLVAEKKIDLNDPNIQWGKIYAAA
ncbi:MAG: hypothetical protein AAGG38_02125 [Planctomycetota bacterium]